MVIDPPTARCTWNSSVENVSLWSPDGRLTVLEAQKSWAMLLVAEMAEAGVGRETAKSSGKTRFAVVGTRLETMGIEKRANDGNSGAKQPSIPDAFRSQNDRRVTGQPKPDAVPRGGL